MHAPTSIHELSETHIPGSPLRWGCVKAHEGDRRAWLKGVPVCATLQTHRIAHAGLTVARAPYRVVRMNQSGVYFLASLEGEGRVLVDGRWRRCGEGQAVVLPPFVVNAFHAVDEAGWKFCWVRYERQEPGHRPLISSSAPQMAAFDGQPIWCAIEGLIAEARGAAQPAGMFHWTELIQGYVERFVQPWREDDRLSRLWEKVAADVGHDWTLDELAAMAFVSTEHLRRLCRKALGRTPMHHVTWLRMRKAAELLSTTHLKVETVSTAVGYQNPFVFSNTFKKWIGWRPSEHRSRSGTGGL
ncbi:MAG: AraC family transcriptional regulator [Verrucomicrobiales bacterium]|nr:AraC family transcriptional regulator [Verrucomicrobiales bacterium]